MNGTKQSASVHADLGHRAFAELERDTEHVLALLRLLAVLILALAFWFIGIMESRHAAVVPLGGLALISLASLVISRRGLFRPWVPWVFVTLDVILLVHCLAMLAITTGQPLQFALETPAATVVLVFLAAAAVRHRPLLILYTGGLFVILWISILLLEQYAGTRSWSSAALAPPLVRLAVVGLATYALFVAVTRAKRTLTASITEARLRANLSRYFSAGLVDQIANTGSAARSFLPQKAAVLFADLRGFTSLAEGMPADQVADFLNEYRRRVTAPIMQHNGTIDKFIGDGVMAIFGVPEPRPDDARNAVQCGLAVVSAIRRWSAERIAGGLPSLEIGVGIHYGDVIAGVLGDEHRLEYTAIGDTVNTTARIERLTADLGTPLLISADVLAAAPGLERDLLLTALPTHFLRGRRQPIQLYQAERNETPVRPVETNEDHKASAAG
jgi:adenylate cyclase